MQRAKRATATIASLVSSSRPRYVVVQRARRRRHHHLSWHVSLASKWCALGSTPSPSPPLSPVSACLSGLRVLCNRRRHRLFQFVFSASTWCATGLTLLPPLPRSAAPAIARWRAVDTEPGHNVAATSTSAAAVRCTADLGSVCDTSQARGHCHQRFLRDFGSNDAVCGRLTRPFATISLAPSGSISIS